MAIKSRKRRKQRKYQHNAPLHIKKKFMACHLSKELQEKYDRRRIPVRKGDTVEVMRGQLKGHKGKVSKVFLKKGRVAVEKANLNKADGTAIPKLMHPSNLRLIKMDTSDPKRRAMLRRKSEAVI